MQNTHIIKMLETAQYATLIATIIAVPLLIDRSLINYFVLIKQYLFVSLILLNLILFSIKTIISRQLNYSQSLLDVPLALLLGFMFLSSIFSSNQQTSFLGRNDIFLMNFTFFAFLIIFYIIVVNCISNYEKWKTAIMILAGVGGISALSFILTSFFKFQIPYINSTLNIVSASITGFGIWLVAIFLICAGQILKKNTKINSTVYYWIVMALCGWGIILISYNVLWWLLLIGTLIILLIGISFIKEVRMYFLSFLFALMVAVVIFIIMGSPKSLQANLPLEMSLGFKPSWSITSESIFDNAKNFILGSGPGSFSADFSKFRTTEFNYNQLAWSLRFSQPFNTYLAILSEHGIATGLAFVLVILLAIGSIFNSNRKKRFGLENFAIMTDKTNQASQIDIYLLLSVFLILLGGMTINFFSPSLWMMWWLLLGLLISGLHLNGNKIIKSRSLVLQNVPQYNLAFSFSIIVITGLVIMLGILGTRFYLAEFAYAQAVHETEYPKIDAKLQKAISLRSNYDSYHMAQARSYLNQAANDAKQGAKEEDIAALVASAVNEAKRATELSPNTVSAWENLATMYENASMLVPEANEWAVKSLEKAIELEPTNAMLHWQLANNYYFANNLPKAETNFKKAIDLKNDYLQAYLGLAQVYEANNKIDEAINTLDLITRNSPRDTGVLFNYGRLLYNRNRAGDRVKAERLWLLVIQDQPKYSNALYSLGLLYETQGEKQKALYYYYKVRDLNPTNQEIKKKIDNLNYVVKPAPVFPTSTSTTSSFGNN
ncbi:MAG: tetratricopeptide repeat protein [bacterium]